MEWARGLVGLILGLSVASGAQDPADEVPTADAPQDAADAPQEAADAPQVDRWIAQLGDPRYAAREEAFARLAELGEKVREALNRAASHEDPEVRWRVARLLDRLKEKSTGRGTGTLRPLQEESGDGEPPPSALKQFRSWEDLEREMEDMVERLQDWDDGELRGFFRGRPFHFRFFDDPFGILDELQEGGALAPVPLDPGPGSRWSSTRITDGKKHTVTIEVRPDGSVVADEEGEDGTRHVESPSWEDFQREHPDLVASFGDLGLQRFTLPSRPLTPGLRPSLPALPRLVPRDETEPTGPVLGVMVEPVPEVLADYLGLEIGEGLQVREVLPGSAAERLGILPRDILLELRGRAIAGVEDVRAAMRDSEGAELHAQVLRRGLRLNLPAR